jgi:hypothetical protein
LSQQHFSGFPANVELNPGEDLKRNIIANASENLHIEGVRDAGTRGGRLLLHPELSVAVESRERDRLMIDGEMYKAGGWRNMDLFRQSRPGEAAANGVGAGW